MFDKIKHLSSSNPKSFPNAVSTEVTPLKAGAWGAEKTLKKLQDKLATNPELEAILAVEGGVWGYSFYFELVQLTDGTFGHFFENDFNKDRPFEKVETNLNIREELYALRTQFNSRLRGVKLPEDDKRGRNAVMFVVLRDAYSWFVLQRPLTTTPRTDTPLDRLYYAVSF